MQSDLFAGWWWHANYLIAVFLACSLWALYAMLEKNGCPPLMLHVDCGPFVLCLLFRDGWVSLWKSRTVPWEGAEKKTCSYTRSVGLLLIVLCYKGCSWLMDHFFIRLSCRLTLLPVVHPLASLTCRAHPPRHAHFSCHGLVVRCLLHENERVSGF